MPTLFTHLVRRRQQPAIIPCRIVIIFEMTFIGPNVEPNDVCMLTIKTGAAAHALRGTYSFELSLCAVIVTI